MYMKMEANLKQESREKCSKIGGLRKSPPKSLIVILLTLMFALTEIIIVTARPAPDRYRVGRRREDSDYDDLDQGASAPYQNQEGDGSQNADGYEDGEPDGPYDETPRDEDGQADLEKFFDDHLGASERDGMDKENLPTNLVPLIMRSPKIVPGPQRDTELNGPSFVVSPQVYVNKDSILPYAGSASNPSMIYLDNSLQHRNQPPSLETSYIKLPNKKLIVTRQITRSPIYKGGLDLPNISSILQSNNVGNFYELNQPRQEALNANGSEIVATENDDMDRIYVTNVTNKPFKIAQLGGYDPEEDFQDASRDFEEAADRHKSSSNGGRRSSEEDAPQQIKDISFNDPEDETLFNDASETDEVFFAHDPYQTDLESELKGEQSPKEASDSSDNVSTRDSEAESRSMAKNHPTEDDSEGSWVNDGVEDMDIPSQSYQDAVLEKAAKQEASKRAASENPDEETAPTQEGEPSQEGESIQEGEPTNGDPDNQRMPNADYLKDMDDIDGPAM